MNFLNWKNKMAYRSNYPDITEISKVIEVYNKEKITKPAEDYDNLKMWKDLGEYIMKLQVREESEMACKSIKIYKGSVDYDLLLWKDLILSYLKLMEVQEQIEDEIGLFEGLTEYIGDSKTREFMFEFFKRAIHTQSKVIKDKMDTFFMFLNKYKECDCKYHCT